MRVDDMRATVPEAAQKALSPAGIRAAARQTQGLIRIPPRLQSAIAHYLGEYPTHEVKLSVSRLSEAMRNTKFALQQVDDPQESGDDDTPDMPPLNWQKKVYSRGQLFNKYRERDASAYVAARMPAVYSAIYRVLSEVYRRLPDFRPSHIMDYGSGPGTAIWALCEVWPASIERANIVEPSQAMSYARRSLFQAMKAHLPDTRNFTSLDGFAREVRPADRVHDLVIASYSLGELKTAEERISVARQLWGLTKDILVIIEPGSPRGSTVVREIRSHILCMENKRAWRHKRKHDASPAEQDFTVCTEHPKEKIGAFVVAPCAHNGVCPMDGTEKFCHFSQRIERSSSQLLYKRLKGKALRGYEDEKFSFVVLRKGSRPRMEWPLDRADASAFEAEKKTPRFYGVIIEEPGEFDEDEEEEEKDGGTEDEEYSCDEEGKAGMKERGEEGSEEEGGNEEEEEAGAADTGSGWGRILFPPIRRGKRVVLDVCRSSDADGSKGMLQRITVTRSRHKLLHFQARRSKWGDLWPFGAK